MDPPAGARSTVTRGWSIQGFSFDAVANQPFFGALPRSGWHAVGVFEMICAVLLVVPVAAKWMPTVIRPDDIDHISPIDLVPGNGLSRVHTLILKHKWSNTEQMIKNAKQPSDPKKGESKHQGDVNPETDLPAEEIADDEVEIGSTGGKPGTQSTPVTKRKP